MRCWLGRGRGPDPDWAAVQLERRGIRDPQVLRAMRAVPREKFVPSDLASAAYDDGALPIGYGQTISQPYIVASMTQALMLPKWSAAHNGERATVLDVGTGSGYQAAVLAEMGARVVSIEREAALAAEAQVRLQSLGYDVKVIVGDGSAGAPGESPFAAIVVAAASPENSGPARGPAHVRWPARNSDRHTPRSGDHSCAPTEDGFTREPLEPAVFVPLIGEHGFTDR